MTFKIKFGTGGIAVIQAADIVFAANAASKKYPSRNIVKIERMEFSK